MIGTSGDYAYRQSCRLVNLTELAAPILLHIRRRPKDIHFQQKRYTQMGHVVCSSSAARNPSIFCAACACFRDASCSSRRTWHEGKISTADSKCRETLSLSLSLSLSLFCDVPNCQTCFALSKTQLPCSSRPKVVHCLTKTYVRCSPHFVALL